LPAIFTYENEAENARSKAKVRTKHQTSSIVVVRFSLSQ